MICKPGDLRIICTVCKFFLLVLFAAAGMARVKITAKDITEGAASPEKVEHLSEGEGEESFVGRGRRSFGADEEREACPDSEVSTFGHVCGSD